MGFLRFYGFMMLSFSCSELGNNLQKINSIDSAVRGKRTIFSKLYFKYGTFPNLRHKNFEKKKCTDYQTLPHSYRDIQFSKRSVADLDAILKSSPRSPYWVIR
jgi:hypothetical protein